LPAGGVPFDKSESAPAGPALSRPVGAADSEIVVSGEKRRAAKPSVHRSETTVTSLPIQSRAQAWFHRGQEAAREGVYVALANSELEPLRRRAGRLAMCCMSPSFWLRSDSSVSVGVVRCRDRLCPTCARARAAKARLRAKVAVGRMDAIRFVTLTMPHRDDALVDQLSTLRSAFTRLRKSSVWRRCVTGGLCTIEITRNERDGQWHPHLHALVDGRFIPHEELREAWRRALNHSVKREWIAEGELVIVDVRATSGRSGAVQYITKYATKPADLIGWTKAAVCEVADALAGARTLSTFGHLHGETLDERDPNEVEDESSLICNLCTVQMRRNLGCPLAEAFIVLLCRVSKDAAAFLHPCPARASPMPAEVLADAPGMLWILGREFREHSPHVPIHPPWISGKITA